jgi:hypothetical protein
MWMYISLDIHFEQGHLQGEGVFKRLVAPSSPLSLADELKLKCDQDFGVDDAEGLKSGIAHDWSLVL